MDFFYFMNILILTLAIYRITLLLTKEDGPYYVFERLRNWAGVYYGPDNQAWGDNILAQILSCFYCCSLWIAIFLSGIYWYSPLLAVSISIPFALSGGAIILWHVQTRIP